MITERMWTIWYCYFKQEMKYNNHPLSFQQIDKVQKVDKHFIKIIKLEKTVYYLQAIYEGEGGG